MQIKSEVRLRMVFLQETVLNISEPTQFPVYVEDEYSINVPCAELVDSRPHVCFRALGITSQVRVLLSSEPISGAKILSQRQERRLVVQLNVTRNGVSSVSSHEVGPNAELHIEGVDIYFSSLDEKVFRETSVLFR